jgi:thymidylate synthase
MNKLDLDYQNLLKDILDNGVKKETRNGSTLSVFGRQIRHKMSEGFPLLTTKKMHWKSIVTELLWFLRGDTNIKYLVDNNCHIWNGDAYKSYLKHNDEVDNYWIKKNPEIKSRWKPHSKEEFINKIKTDDEFAKKWGELGPVYGKQWRDWKGFKQGLFADFENGTHDDKKQGIDQIANLIRDLKTNPDSRRLMVNAWNVGEIDQMVLPPCHYGFQLYTRVLTTEEQYKDYPELLKLYNDKVAAIRKQDYAIAAKYRAIEKELLLRLPELPTRAISLMWNQRSVDTFLGLPFNIASYGLLLEIIAKEVNMVPDELIGNLGDVHLYLNHIEQAKEQIGKPISHFDRCKMAWPIYYPERKDEEIPITWNLKELTMNDLGIPKKTREPYPLPKLWINDLRSDTNSIINDITKWSHEDFKIENYQSHPTIKAPLSN